MRRPHTTLTWLPVLVLGLLWNGPAATQEKAEGTEPERIRVQHLLIGFKGSLGGKKYLERDKKQAEALAKQLLERATSEEDFAALVKEYTDDSYPGIYKMVNKKIQPLAGELRRFDMKASFGNVSFSLQVGEVGMAEYHPTKSPFGWHIIKRIK